MQSLQPPSEVLTKILALSEISKDSKCEDAIHARNQLNREDLYLAQREVISFQIQLLHYELQTLHVASMTLADEYHLEKKLNPDNRGSLSVRVRLRSSVEDTFPSLTIEWSKFEKKQSGVIFSKYIKRGASYQYPKSTVKGCKEWEIDMFNLIEPKFASIRK